MSQNLHSGHRERLRDKYINNKSFLEDHEILELILTYSIPRKNTNDIAHLLINRFGSIENVINADMTALMQIKGVGKNTAVFIDLLKQIAYKGYIPIFTSKELFSVEKVTPLLITLFQKLDHEKFLILFLDKSNRCYNQAIVEGEKDKVLIPGKQFIKLLRDNKPAAIIVAHNHPDRERAAPSFDDDLSTEKIYWMLKLNSVKFYDHLIVSDNDIFSYFSSGRLQFLKENSVY